MDDKLSIADSEIDQMFQQLDQLHIQSEVSIAYNELIKSIRNTEPDKEEIREVIEGYGLNPFEYIQID